jgi:hypothetical protein
MEGLGFPILEDRRLFRDFKRAAHNTMTIVNSIDASLADTTGMT